MHRLKLLGVVTVACVSLAFSVPEVNARTMHGAPDNLADLVQNLTPAVVNISTTKEMKTPKNPFGDIPEGHPFGDLFEKFFDAPGGKGGAPSQRKATSLGSGFVISADGHVVTNNHVIDGADEITVTFGNDEDYEAKVIGRDPKTDLAVLKIDAGKKLPFVEFGDSDASRVGDWIVVIGNPFGLGGTVTTGIISAKTRDINAGPFDDFIQTDAAINRGNSGGPMFNLDGKVIGINTAIFSPGGLGNIGIGFSIPASLAQPLIEQLKTNGTIRRGWLGVRIQTVTDDIAESMGMKDAKGALVAEVLDGSPAEKAGIEIGDVIVSFDGKEVPEMKKLPRIVAETSIGKSVKVGVFRDGKVITKKVGVEKLEEDEVADMESDKDPDFAANNKRMVLGLIVDSLSSDQREELGLEKSAKGLLVENVDPESAAAERGLRRGDVLLEINRQKAESVSQVKKVVESAKKKDRSSVLLLIHRAGDTLFLALPIGDE